MTPKEYPADPPDPLALITPKDELWDIEGWQRYTAGRSFDASVAMMTRDEYQALAPADRLRFDLRRKISASNLPKIETPMAAPVRKQIQVTVDRNLLNRDPGPREGIFLSANPGLGKSTLVREIAADFDEQVRGLADIVPSTFGHNDRWIPVVWISVPSKVSIISLCRRILYFFGYEMRQGARQSELEQKVLTLVRNCGVQLMVFDDITRLNMNRDSDKDVADWIRHLMEASLTVLGIGVDIESSGLTKDAPHVPADSRAALKQNRSRFSLHTLARFTYDTESEIDAWIAHLMAVENSLPLLDSTPGMLSGDIAELLYARSNGVIGTLHNLISKACLGVIGRPIDDGGEWLTEHDLRGVVLDIEAEQAYRASLPTPKPPSSKRKPSRRRSTNSAFDGKTRRTTA